MTPADSRSGRVGRPRLIDDSDSDRPPREQILEAAAALFSENGFEATSTRAIAERVGIRQASLYYHFAGKDEILIELLTTSVRPSMDFVRQLEAQVPAGATPGGALYALALVDVETLMRTPHNIGTLYLLPEVQSERYDPFRLERLELQQAYGRLGIAACTAEVEESVGEATLGAILIQLAELVIQLRRTGEPGEDEQAAIAASCLRVCGLDETTIPAARAEAVEILSAVEEALAY